VDYAVLNSIALKLVTASGLPVKVTRDGSLVTNAQGVFVGALSEDLTLPTSSLMAQTASNTRRLLVAGAVKDLLVGDEVVADKVTYVVTTAEKIRPSTTTLLWKLEVKA